MNSVALLIGNDINNVNNDLSWQNLLKDIVCFCRAKRVDISEKPFPLLYEEIFLSSSGVSEIGLKQFIARTVNTIQPNEIHRKILSLNIDDILTTNYEYAIEKSTENNAETIKNNGIVKETRYSIFRHAQIKNKRIWHIHGECNKPSSITLGYEHYGATIQQIRNYVVTGPRYKSRKIDNLPLIQRIKESRVDVGNIYSWIEVFFMKDIHILGLSLDYAEVDLWWLLTYRARCRLNKGISNITNKIFYYLPKEYEQDSKQKIQLLKAVDVHVIVKGGSDRKGFYLDVLESIPNMR